MTHVRYSRDLDPMIGLELSTRSQSRAAGMPKFGNGIGIIDSYREPGAVYTPTRFILGWCKFMLCSSARPGREKLKLYFRIIVLDHLQICCRFAPWRPGRGFRPGAPGDLEISSAQTGQACFALERTGSIRRYYPGSVSKIQRYIVLSDRGICFTTTDISLPHNSHGGCCMTAFLR